MTPPWTISSSSVATAILTNGINVLARPPPVVDTSEDLFKMFDLTATASKVARVDEKGEKKPLRKSYKSYLKTLKIDGHFEPVKREATDAGHLLSGLCEVPEQEWHVHFVQGREVESGMSQDVLDLLDNACTMNKGNINSIWNPSVLGDLAPGKVAGSMKGRETAPGTPMGGYPAGAVARPSALSQVRSALDLNRPRKNKKRALGDAGFEGFGEGAQDDDVGMETGYSTADGDERAPVQKRRKKVQLPGRILFLSCYYLLTLAFRTPVVPLPHSNQSARPKAMAPTWLGCKKGVSLPAVTY